MHHKNDLLVEGWAGGESSRRSRMGDRVLVGFGWNLPGHVLDRRPDIGGPGPPRVRAGLTG